MLHVVQICSTSGEPLCWQFPLARKCQLRADGFRCLRLLLELRLILSGNRNFAPIHQEESRRVFAIRLCFSVGVTNTA